MMNLLIAYDGSASAQAAIDDLRRAGLPDAVDALIIAVAELHVLPPLADGAFGGYADSGDRGGSARAAAATKEAERIAAEGREMLRARFPTWNIADESMLGSPASMIVGRADERRPDLLVVGAHGRSLFERLFIGSVSQTVLAEASCSVRVARGGNPVTDGPARLMVAVDGSAGSMDAVRAIAARRWPQGSVARIVAAVEPIYTSTLPPLSLEVALYDEAGVENEEEFLADNVAEGAALLKAAGLEVSEIMDRVEPKRLILSESESWRADCVYMGARGLSPVERFLLGSISRAVAARARCSVEVVRTPDRMPS